MRQLLVMGGLLLPLAGCGFVPPAISIASVILDVGSVAVSGKTVADLGVSAVANRDCALIRVVTEGQLCREPVEYETALAALDPLPPGIDPERVDAMSVPAELGFLQEAAPGVVVGRDREPMFSLLPISAPMPPGGATALFAEAGYLADTARVARRPEAVLTGLSYMASGGHAHRGQRFDAAPLIAAAPPRKPAALVGAS